VVVPALDLGGFGWFRVDPWLVLDGTCTPTGDDGLVYEQTAKCCQHFKFICSIYKHTNRPRHVYMGESYICPCVIFFPVCACVWVSVAVCACY